MFVSDPISPPPEQYPIGGISLCVCMGGFGTII